MTYGPRSVPNAGGDGPRTSRGRRL